jgi:ABC-2 type transport system permease protein
MTHKPISYGLAILFFIFIYGGTGCARVGEEEIEPHHGSDAVVSETVVDDGQNGGHCRRRSHAVLAVGLLSAGVSSVIIPLLTGKEQAQNPITPLSSAPVPPRPAADGRLDHRTKLDQEHEPAGP